MRGEPRRLLLCAVPLLTACGGPQSVHDPAGPTAASIHGLGIVLYVVATVVTLLVTALALAPFLRRRARPANQRLFLWTGVALPGLTLAALMPYVFTVGREMRIPPGSRHLVVDVTGHVYWWEVSYRPHGRPPVASANELRVPVGEPVELRLHSGDVIHSFWVPALAGKMDNIPGRVNRLVIQADRPGVYRGQCAEYCGAQHAFMALDVVAVPRAELDEWLARLARPVGDPATPELRRGRDLFVELGCGACHAIRGLTDGRVAPDLTQVGARRSLAGGALPGGVGNLAGWIASAQHIKPGNRMPSFDQLDGQQLRDLAAYLGSLR